jgi:hypothetical protein
MGPEKIGRREFIKEVLAVAATVPSILKDMLKNGIENSEDIGIVERKDWDEVWDDLSSQYSKELGAEFSFTLGGKKRTRLASSLSYIDFETNTNLDKAGIVEILKGIYQRIVVHHTEVKAEGEPLDQVKLIRDSQIISRKFNDIAYNFIIATDGTIYAGRPLTHMGLHAGYTNESKDYEEKHLENGVAIIFKEQGEEKTKLIEHFKKANMMDPDYGSVGIALCGDFDGSGKPTEAQVIALSKLLNDIKKHLDIPTKNIIGHNEVGEKVIRASGLTQKSPKKTCPGKGLDLEGVNKFLEEDTSKSEYKSLLLPHS